MPMPEKPDDLGDSCTMVWRMPRNDQDPAANTQAFRAFATNGESARQGPNTALIVGVVAAVVVVVAIAAVLLLG
jgi:hypothetical protein